MDKKKSPRRKKLKKRKRARAKASKNQKASCDSSTRVNYPQSVFSGVRKTVGFKCDTGLYKEFKRVAQATMGSVCRPLECFMIAILAIQKEQVNFGETVKIENLHIERNLRSRRRLVVEEEVSVKEVVVPCCDFCGKAPVVGAFQNIKTGKRLHVCNYHAGNLRKRHQKWCEVDFDGC